MIRVFVYGTLKRGRPLDRAEFAKLRKDVEEAEIEGAIYDLGWYPGVRLDEEGIVRGEVHSFDEKDDFVLDILDGIEGYSPGRPESQNLYNRRTVIAKTLSGKKVKAFIYEINHRPRSERRLKDGVWEPHAH